MRAMARSRPSGREVEGMTLPEPSRNRQALARGAQLIAATLFLLAPTVLCAGALPGLGDRILLAQTTTTDNGAAVPAQGSGGDVNASTSATSGTGVDANTSAASGVNANTSAAEEQPQAPRQPAVETTPFGLTIYRGSGSQ